MISKTDRKKWSVYFPGPPPTYISSGNRKLAWTYDRAEAEELAGTGGRVMETGVLAKRWPAIVAGDPTWEELTELHEAAIELIGAWRTVANQMEAASTANVLRACADALEKALP